jgi:hypothetical protein
MLMISSRLCILYDNIYSSLDLSADIGQMSQLISIPCSKGAGAPDKTLI